LDDVSFGRAVGFCGAYIIQKNDPGFGGGRPSNKTNAKRLTPWLCALFERSE